MSWTLDEALAVIREHQAFARECDYNLALAGGVLNNGSSQNDLDIIALPRSARRTPSPRSLVNRIFGKYQAPQELTDYDAGDGDDDLAGRTIYRGQLGPDKRVDLIVVDFAEAVRIRCAL